MDKKTINNKEVKAVVKFECFLFSPYFNRGEHGGVFFLHAWSSEHERYLVSSDIVNIHEIDNIVYIETQNSVYELDGSESIYHLEDIKRYLSDEEYTSSEFYDKCVPNIMPTSRGWRVY